MKNTPYLIPLIIFITTFFIYYLSASGETPYNYFTRLSEAFLQGRNYLSEAPPHLNELVAKNGRFYVVYPPMPSIMLLPFVGIFGQNFSQTLFANFLGALNPVLFFFLLRARQFPLRTSFWLSGLLALGTNHWYLASTGSAWYLAHITAVFFLLLAIWEIFRRKRPFLIGIFLGAAFLSRLPTILSLPFFIILLSEKNKAFTLNLTKLLLGLLPFLIFAAAYNFSRFGDIFQFGYGLIPGVLQEFDFRYGIFNPAYLPKQLAAMLLTPPVFLKEFPFVRPSWAGMSLLLTTPAIVFSLKANFKERIVVASWLAAFLTAIPSLTHGTTGYSQFGYRFAWDFLPFLLTLTALGIGQNLYWYHKIFIIISILVNLWGVLWINKFGWVGW